MGETNTQEVESTKRGGWHQGWHQGVKVPPTSDTTRRVLQLLCDGQSNKKDIAKHLNISRKNLYKHINRLIELRFYDPERGGVTQGGYTFLGTSQGSKKFRSHAYEAYYLLPEGIDKNEWKRKRGAVLTTNKIKWEKVELKNKQGMVQDEACKFYVQDLQAIAYANGVYVWFPEEVADSPSGAAKLQVLKIAEYAKHLSNIFKGIDFLKDNKLNVQIRKSEIAHLKDVMAHELRQEEKKLYVSVGKELRVICDFSNNIDEWETVSVGHGVTDHHALETYKEDIAKSGQIKEFTQDLVQNGSPEDYVRDIIKHKPEEMPGVQTGVFLPSEVVRMFGEQARHNATLSVQLTKLSEIMAKQTENLIVFGQKIDKYGAEIDKHLEMVGSVTTLANTMAVQSKASINLVEQLSSVVHRMTGIKVKPRKYGQKSLTEFGGRGTWGIYQ